MLKGRCYGVFLIKISIFVLQNDLRKNKKSMATVSWVVFKHHKKSDGTYNPKIRISHNRTSSYISTPIYTDMVRFKKKSASGTITLEKIKEELDN